MEALCERRFEPTSRRGRGGERSIKKMCKQVSTQMTVSRLPANATVQRFLADNEDSCPLKSEIAEQTLRTPSARADRTGNFDRCVVPFSRRRASTGVDELRETGALLNVLLFFFCSFVMNTSTQIVVMQMGT